MAETKKPEVTIFTTPDCPYCIRAKEYLGSMKIGFSEFNVREDRAGAKMMLQVNPAGSVPTMLINGRVVVGFNPQLIDDALSRPPPPKREVFMGNLIFDPFER
jgi:glutaredoxin